MRRTAHAVLQFVAIVAVVATTPPLAIRTLTAVFGGGDHSTPAWWDRACLGALAVFVVAAAFLAWDSRRIGRIEENGIVVNRLRAVPPRRHRR
ncbi:hypothetical protein BH18ACT4_BH18ACT4_07650 [soil metagenome]